MEYIVITHQTDSPTATDNLSNKINEKLQEGFKLAGSMQIIPIFTDTDQIARTVVMYQPMVKD